MWEGHESFMDLTITTFIAKLGGKNICYFLAFSILALQHSRTNRSNILKNIYLQISPSGLPKNLNMLSTNVCFTHNNIPAIKQDILPKLEVRRCFNANALRNIIDWKQISQLSLPVVVMSLSYV